MTAGSKEPAQQLTGSIKPPRSSLEERERKMRNLEQSDRGREVEAAAQKAREKEAQQARDASHAVEDTTGGAVRSVV